MTNKERNIHVYIKYDREREREQKKSIYIYTYTLYISSENDWNSPLVDCISRWWLIHLCQPWSLGQCTLSHNSAAQLFWFQFESNWIDLNQYEPQTLRLYNIYNIRTLWSSSLPGCALDILRQCQISVSIESWDCSPKNATVKNVWSLCDFTRNQKWLIFWSAFTCLSKYVFVDDRLLDLRPPSLLTLATIWIYMGFNLVSYAIWFYIGFMVISDRVCVCVCGSFRVLRSLTMQYVYEKIWKSGFRMSGGSFVFIFVRSWNHILQMPPRRKKWYQKKESMNLIKNLSIAVPQLCTRTILPYIMNCFAQSQLSKLASCNSMFDCRAKLSRASSAKPQALFRLLLIYPQC